MKKLPIFYRRVNKKKLGHWKKFTAMILGNLIQISGTRILHQQSTFELLGIHVAAMYPKKLRVLCLSSCSCQLEELPVSTRQVLFKNNFGILLDTNIDFSFAHVLNHLSPIWTEENLIRTGMEVNQS